MKRKPSRTFGVAAVLLLAGAGLWIWLLFFRGDTYEAYRQTKDQMVPGALTLELKAVPEGFRPTITPQQAYDIAWDQPIAGQMHRTLAVTYDTYSGGDSRPDWVFIARRQCYPSAKGDLVSPARSGMVGKTCTDKNLALVSVDAETGKPAMAFVAYDPSEDWAPANAIEGG